MPELSIGSIVTVIGPKGKVLEGEYTVVQVIDKDVLRVIDKNKVPMRIHKCRVAAIVNQKAKEQEEASMNDNAEAAVCEEPKAKAEAKVESKTKKEIKPKKTLMQFDIEAWVKEKGGGSGIHLSKKCKFDNDKVGCHAHCVINPSTGRYYMINVYTYPPTTEFPQGVVSLGKNNVGGSEYPLKGHRLTVEVKKQSGGKEKIQRMGKHTPEELVAELTSKKGYKQIKEK